jgi:hypothetical protein
MRIDEFPRYRFVSDDDGHNYIIPAGMQKQFDRWLESCQDDAPPYSGFTFDENRIDSPSNYTFTSPKEDE